MLSDSRMPLPVPGPSAVFALLTKNTAHAQTLFSQPGVYDYVVGRDVTALDVLLAGGGGLVTARLSHLKSGQTLRVVIGARDQVSSTTAVEESGDSQTLLVVGASDGLASGTPVSGTPLHPHASPAVKVTVGDVRCFPEGVMDLWNGLATRAGNEDGYAIFTVVAPGFFSKTDPVDLAPPSLLVRLIAEQRERKNQ